MLVCSLGVLCDVFGETSFDFFCFFLCYFLLLLHTSFRFSLFFLLFSINWSMSLYFCVLIFRVDERVFISVFGNIKLKVSYCLIQHYFKLLLIRLQDWFLLQVVCTLLLFFSSSSFFFVIKLIPSISVVLFHFLGFRNFCCVYTLLVWF